MDFSRYTYNSYWDLNPLKERRPSAFARFAERRMRGPWGGSFLETAFITFNPFLGGPIGAVGWTLGWGAILAPMEIGRGVVQGLRAIERLGGAGPRPEFAGPVVDTRMAYTMRQAALNAMHNSAYSLRAAIGNEAHLLHR